MEDYFWRRKQLKVGARVEIVESEILAPRVDLTWNIGEGAKSAGSFSLFHCTSGIFAFRKGAGC